MPIPQALLRDETGDPPAGWGVRRTNFDIRISDSYCSVISIAFVVREPLVNPNCLGLVRRRILGQELPKDGRSYNHSQTENLAHGKQTPE